ncbi:MAG: hypothetical protein ACM3YN_14180 [Parcubacteria group bacterium]
MSENREDEARAWAVQEADADRAVAEMKRSLDRLRGQVGAYREQVVETDETTGDGAES